MTAELTAEFEKRLVGGPVIRSDIRRPADAFSVTVLFGPSGVGKTTILRCLAGVERPDTGCIRRFHVDCGFPLMAVITNQACEELSLQPGETVTLLVKAPAIHLIPRS